MDMRSPQTSGADSAKGDAGRARAMRAAIGAAIIVAAAAAYFVWSWYADRHPSTNDAYVGAHVVRIAPQVTGKVAAVHVASYSAVKKGDVLVDLDAAPFEATVRSAEADVEMARQQARSLESAVAEARAQLAASEAALTDARSDWERVSRLVKAGSMAKAQGDTQKSTFRQAEAQFQAAQATLNKAQAALGSPGDSNAAVLAAQAKLDQARLDLSHTRIVAPADGFVGEVETRPGSFANTGTELLQLVDTGEWWVDANFKEGDLERIRLLFDDLETQRELVRLLGDAEKGEGVRIFIGSENRLFSLSGSSLVVSPYRDSEQRVVGVLGVIGPTRLNYARIVPMVDYTAKVVGRLLG